MSVSNSNAGIQTGSGFGTDFVKVFGNEKVANGVSSLTATFANIAKTAYGCPNCYSVCAKTYWTDQIANGQCSAAPQCNGNVIAYKTCTYACPEQSCGAYKGGNIKIELKNSDGASVATYDTRTDTKGRFSYTFTAPSLEGKYAVVVTGNLES